jgi:putative spermidine/putrescine transport system permease protein
MTRDWIGWGGYALVAVLALVPVGLSLIYALLYSVEAVGLLADGVTGEHWRALAGGRTFWRSVGWSAYVAAASVALTLLIALPLGLWLHDRIVGGRLGAFLYLPLAIPATVSAFLVLQLLAPFGLVTRVARGMGALAPTDSLPPLVYDGLGVGLIVAHVGLAVPFFLLLFAEIYAQERVGELARAAQTLGASTRQATWRVSVPLLLRQAGPNVLLLFVVVLGAYEAPLLLDRQDPQMLSVLVMRAFQRFDLSLKPTAYAIALLHTGLVVAVLAAVFRRLRVAA